jgi:CRP-like cAMP-binding protein
MIAGVEPFEVGRIERIHALRSLFGSGGPSTAALAAMAAVAVAVRIRKGTILAQEGEPATTLWVVVEGELLAMRAGKLLGSYGPRHVVGSLAALSRDPRGFRCTAAEDTIALQLRADDMYEVFEDHFGMLQTVMEALARGSIEIRRGIKPDAGYDGALAPDPEAGTDTLDLVERMLVLRKSLAMHTHIDELAELARAAQEVHYLAETSLWQEEDRATHLLVLVSGSVRALNKDGLQFKFGPGDLVGGLDMVAGAPRWYEAISERDVIALSIDRETLLDLCEDQAELGFDFLHLLAEILLSLHERTATEPELTAGAST